MRIAKYFYYEEQMYICEKSFIADYSFDLIS
jgi:hypothetical protein